MLCSLCCSTNTEQCPLLGIHSQTLGRQGGCRQTPDKRETIATNRRHRERSGEFKCGLSLSQINPRGSALSSSLHETDTYTLVPHRLSLMHLTDKVLFQSNFGKCMNLAVDWKFKVWGFLLICLEGGGLFVLFLWQTLLVWL